jgi:hypothetical protein
LAKGATDEKHEKKTKKKASAPHNYVSDLQADLIALGYLKAGADVEGEYGVRTERAVKLFRRHAKRKLRWDGATRIVATGWIGTVEDICDYNTAQEVRVWVDKKYRRPLGAYKMVKIDGGFLREDAAKVWTEAIDEAAKLGATLLPSNGPKYADTWRNPAGGFKFTGGNSKTSMHFTGRAVDVSQALANAGKGQRWWVAKEDVTVTNSNGTTETRTYWRVYCKTELQNGSYVKKIVAQSTKHFVFGANTEAWIPEGYYVDLTAFLQDRNFVRIPAWRNFLTNPKGLEWWHFHYSEAIQDTFLDEMELIGVNEQQLRNAGWTQTELDGRPG